MGKKRVIKKAGSEEVVAEEIIISKTSKDIKITHALGRGVVHIRATYNNTMITVTDDKGNMVAWSSAGALGFSGAKKATPFAASRVAEIIIEKIKKANFQEVAVRVSGVGSGRDSAIRALANHGLNIVSIRDTTPIPHNGPRPKKPRRV